MIIFFSDKQSKFLGEHYLLALRARDSGRQRATATLAALVGQECPPLSVAQADLIKAYVQSDVGHVEIAADAQLRVAPILVTIFLITI